MGAPARPSVLEAALDVLRTGNPDEKVRKAEIAAKFLAEQGIGTAANDLESAPRPPVRPARPEKPHLVPPGDVPKRRLGSVEGRAALLHAIAHIEFNAIDLAFDMGVRFARDAAGLGLDPNGFIADWIGVGADEARHFSMVSRRIEELGSEYGALPAHDGLWEAAESTADDFAARLAIAPLILEARGLDVTPGMIKKLSVVGDNESAAILQVIYDDEIGHVACGKRWFDRVCAAKGEEPAQFFHTNRQRYFAGALKPPFNHEARAKAGLSASFYEPI